MTSLCIVTARGCSKRVPRKNIRNFLGQPLVTWPIQAAIKSEIFQNVLISTEDAEIASAAVVAGAIFPFIRPKEVADDYASTTDVLRVVLKQWQNYNHQLPDYCCCLYGTSAFVKSEHLKQAKDLVEENTCVMAVTAYTHPIERALISNAHGYLQYIQPDHAALRTQDCTKSYYDLGQLYFFDVKAFLSTNDMTFAHMRLKPLILPHYTAIDIDTEDDWFLAEILAKAQGL